MLELPKDKHWDMLGALVVILVMVKVLYVVTG